VTATARALAVFFAAVVLALMAACGDDDSDDGPDEGENWELAITRADGSEQVIYLVSEPIVCDSSEDIISLCGEAIVDGQRIAVDFIQVNRSLGESYEVRER
jgi:hypothetical protein